MPFGSWPLLVRPVLVPFLVYIHREFWRNIAPLAALEGGDTLAHVWPPTAPLHLEAWSIDEPQAQITLLIASTQAKARCAECDAPARHVHSRDTRTLADL